MDRQEARGAEDPEVVMEAGPLHAKAICDLTGGQLTVGEDMQDSQT